MEHDQDWIKRLTQTVGERVAYYRSQVTDDRGRKLTAQALADRCTALGLPVGRPAIAKLEAGLRQAITVAEVQVLAQALGVAPVDLLFPVGYADKVEILPGVEAGPYEAFRWFIGGTDWTDELRQKARQPHRPLDTPIQLWEEHARDVNLMLLRHAGQNGPAGAEQLQAARDALKRVRAAMRDKGMTPPELTSDAGIIFSEAPNGSR